MVGSGTVRAIYEPRRSMKPRFLYKSLIEQHSVRRLATLYSVERRWAGDRLICPRIRDSNGKTTRKLTSLFLSVCPRNIERLGLIPNSTIQRFTVLSIETTGQESFETLSNSLADTVLIKTGSGNGNLESSQ